MKLGMPYMGSKRRLSMQIINEIKSLAPNSKHFYDLFGGGGAMSFQALQDPHFETVHYNELNTGVVALLKDIQKNGISEKYYKWISREIFNKNKRKDTWFGGFCKVVWSFGNNQKDYLYGKDVEPLKKLGHDYIVNRCDEAKKELEGIFRFKFDNSNNLFETEYNLHDERKKLCRFAKNRVLELQHIQHLQRIQQLQQLEITNLSYEQVKINTPSSKTVIYLDPPYANTRKYQLEINHHDLLSYIDVMHKKGFVVVVSSYVFDGMKSFFEMEHTSSLCATANNKVIEKLFVHKDFNLAKNSKFELIQTSLF